MWAICKLVCDAPENPCEVGDVVIPRCPRGAKAQPRARGCGSHIHAGESCFRSNLLLPLEGVNERLWEGAGEGEGELANVQRKMQEEEP